MNMRHLEAATEDDSIAGFTIIDGGVQMTLYFPIYKIIFPEEG